MISDADAMTASPLSQQEGASLQSKRRKTTDKSDESDEKSMQDMNEKLQSIWKEAKNGSEEAFEETMSLISKQIEGLIRTGLEAFHRWENTSRELKLLQEESKGKEIEFERLRVSEEKSRTTASVRMNTLYQGCPLPILVKCSHCSPLSFLQNLLCALEASRTEAREASRAAMTEAGLRAELSVVVSQRDEALGFAEESKRKASLFQEELHHVKTKLSRVTQEKIKMERDQRATMSLAKSLDSQGPVDSDYYKRKVSELSSNVQSLNAVLAEKNRHLEEMRRQLERNMSQNRLANLRLATDKGHRNRIRE
jgi:outer membrane murein-binding lipoprotein Lpp